jgi:hypothetical protein
MGWFYGGENLVQVELTNGDKETLTAGGGFQTGLALMVTPLRLESSLGLGFGVTAAWKGAGIEGATFWRLPMSATVHALIPVAKRWFIVPRAGVFGDFSARLSIHGLGANASAQLLTGLGRQVEIALYWAAHAQRGLLTGLRYSQLEYSVRGNSINGNSLGWTFCLYYNF